jgi:hypothetical protein
VQLLSPALRVSNRRMAAGGGPEGDIFGPRPEETSDNEDFSMFQFNMTQQTGSGEPKSGFYTSPQPIAQLNNATSSNSTSKEHDPNVVRVREYPLDHKGPFVVFIKEKNSPLAHVTISIRINETFKNDVKSLVRMNRSKIRVELTSAKVANEVLKCQFLGGYITYIPAESVEIDGVVNLEHGINMNDIVENGTGKFSHPLVPSVKVIQAFRFRRLVREVDQVRTYENTETIRVTFSGTALPRWLCLHGLLVRVRMYNPKLMSCEKCLGDHHTSKHCTTGIRCLKCKGAHETTGCPDLSVWCSHCHENVKHDSKEDCPTYFARTQKLIGAVKKTSRKSYSEAVRQANQTTTENRYSMLNPNESEVTQGTQGSSQIKFPRMPRNYVPNNPFVFGKRKRLHSPENQQSNQFQFTTPVMPNPPAANPEKRKTNSNRKPNNHTTSFSQPASSSNADNFAFLNPNFLRQQLVSLVATFDISPPARAMIEMLISFLVEMLWPKFTSFISQNTGNTASSNQNPFRGG